MQMGRARRHGDRGVVRSLALSTTAGYGVLFYAYGVLLGPMEDDLGWSRAFLSGAFSAALVIAAICTVPVGRWLDRHPARPLLLCGSVTATGFVLAWANASNRVLYVGVWLVLGACQAILFYEPAFTILTKRFHGHERNRAITSVTLLAGLASTIFGPLTATLEHHFGWRTTAVVLAGVLAVITMPAFAFGVREPQGAAPPVTMPSSLPGEALRTRSFWLLSLAYLLSAVTTFGVAVHLVSYLREDGFSTGTAATVLGAVGFVQVLGRATFIRLSAERASIHIATWVMALKALGLVLLLVVAGAPGIVLFVVVYGSTNGLSTLTRATTIAELYGHEHYGQISAVIASISAIAGALAPFAVAAAADVVGTLGPVFLAMAVLTAAAACTNEVVGRSTRRAAIEPRVVAAAAEV